MDAVLVKIEKFDLFLLKKRTLGQKSLVFLATKTDRHGKQM